MRRCNTFLLIMLCVTVGTQLSHAREAQFSSRPVNMRDVKLNLAPFCNIGLVMGDGAELIEDWGGDQADKLLYGGGLSLVYYPVGKYGLALNTSYQVKKIPGRYTPDARGWFYSASFIYNLCSLRKTFPYARFDAGLLTATYPRDGVDLELGTYSYLRLGVGIFTKNSGSFNMRCELFYQRAFSKGRTIDELGDYEIDFMAECLAVEIGFGIPLAWH